MTASEVRVLRDQPERGWTTELSEIFVYDEASSWVLHPLRRSRWAAHPGFGSDSLPSSDPRALLTG
jgi:hypothetical protein